MTIEDVKDAEIIKRIVARCIASKTWRSECDDEVNAYTKGDKPARAVALGYVRAEYDKAGAGYRGRWQ